MIDIHLLTELVNAAALILFLLLVGATAFSIIRRALLYRAAERPQPVLLRRSAVLIAALCIIGGEAAFLRVLGVMLEPDSVERLLFIIQSDVVLLAALGYYAKVELFDIDDPTKP